MKKLIPAILTLITWPVLSFAVQSNNPELYVLCKFDKSIRTIRIEKSGEQCRTTYTKMGIDQIVADAKKMGSCQNVLNSIRSNLEKGAWKCRDVGSATLTVTDTAKAE